jgi:hypothetical protein
VLALGSSSFFESPAFGAIVALAGVLLVEWLRGRRERAGSRAVKRDAHRAQQRAWALELQDALAAFFAAETKYKARELLQGAVNQPDVEADLATTTFRTTSLISRLEDERLRELAEDMRNRVADQLESTTGQEFKDSATAVMDAIHAFNDRIAELLTGELRYGP